ncbi:MAG TPA: histidine kinase, partial [Ktedonobacteraceae bacterium]|nr:histidine kinase [Ktedonobacteraceae bacterium]
MEQLDILLQLIAHLQNDSDTIHGRRLLLEYARTRSGARLALLVRLDEEHQQLYMLARNGRRPRNVSGQLSARHIPENIPLHGRFGTALETHGFLYIPDLYTDEQSVPEERYWAWPGGLVVTCTVGQHGILVLCFAPQKRTAILDAPVQSPIFDEDIIRICASLLSGYLIDVAADARTVVPQFSLFSPSSTLAYSAAAQFDAVIDRERERIARDIHDGPAQQIASVLHRLEYIQRILLKRPQEALREIGQARQNLNEGLRDLRQCITTMIPAQLQQQSLSEALYALTQDNGHLHIIVEASNLISVPSALEVPIYRFVQEALNNVR